MCKVRALNTLLTHPDETRIKSEIEARRTRAEHDHTATFRDEGGDRKGLFTRMFEHDVDILLSGNVPDRLAELTCFTHEGVEFRRIDGRQLAPAIKVLAVDHAFGAKAQNIIAL